LTCSNPGELEDKLAGSSANEFFLFWKLSNVFSILMNPDNKLLN